MKIYEEYKTTQFIWLDKLPSNWNVTKVKYSTYVKGRIGWKGLRSDEFLNEGAYLVTGTDFIDGKIDWDSCDHVTNERYEEDPYIQLKEGDLLITKDGTIGKTALVSDMPDCACLNSGIFVTRPINKNYISRYLYWLLNSLVFEIFINYNKTGSTILHLYQNAFDDFAFPTPSIKEQTLIAKYIDYKTSLIDKLIDKNEKLIQLLEEQRSAIINQAVTKGLNPDVKMNDSGIEWIGEIPEHWQEKKLKYISDNIATGSTPPTNQGKHYSSNDINWFTPADYLSDADILYSSSRKLSQIAVDDGLIELFPEDSLFLVGIGATIGKIGIITQPSYANQQINIISFNSKHFSMYYFYTLGLAKDYIFETANFATLPIFNQTALKNFTIIVPPEKEQRDISKYLDYKTSLIDNLVDEKRKTNEYLKEYRTTLISNVVTGKIDVRNEVIPDTIN